MSPTMQMTAPPAVYTPTSDAMDRHEYGVSKNRKAASTGGGRAWSEDEVCLQTEPKSLGGNGCTVWEGDAVREIDPAWHESGADCVLLSRKFIFSKPVSRRCPTSTSRRTPKKTELACRLHYHQLSHGSNRRKRTTSVSSSSSTGRPLTHPAGLHTVSDPRARWHLQPIRLASEFHWILRTQQPEECPAAQHHVRTAQQLATPACDPPEAGIYDASPWPTSPACIPHRRSWLPPPLPEPHPHSAPLMASASLPLCRDPDFRGPAALCSPIQRRGSRPTPIGLLALPPCPPA